MKSTVDCAVTSALSPFSSKEAQRKERHKADSPALEGLQQQQFHQSVIVVRDKLHWDQAKLHAKARVRGVIRIGP